MSFSVSALTASSLLGQSSTSSKANDVDNERDTRWEEKHKGISRNNSFLVKFFAYAAGSTLPTTMRKSTRTLPSTNQRQGISEWYFCGQETRLLWVSGPTHRNSSHRIRDGLPYTPSPPLMRQPQPQPVFHNGFVPSAPPPMPTMPHMPHMPPIPASAGISMGGPGARHQDRHGPAHSGAMPPLSTGSVPIPTFPGN